LKAAFDKVNRNRLWEVLRRGGAKEELVRGVRKIYEETVVAVRTRKGLSRSFKTTKGVRLCVKGCVMSSLLFNIYIAELEERLEKRGIGGIGIGNSRVWNLAYADDLVLLAKNREAMVDMMSTLKIFLKDRDMELNTEKSKMLIFNRKRREKKERWEWNKKEIEEVQEFKYLGFVLNKYDNYMDQIKDLVRKGRMAAKKVWGLGERICRNDFKRRWNLFRYLMQSVMEYAVEMWGWDEKIELEKIIFDYIQMDVWFRVLYTKIYNIQETRTIKIKCNMGNKSN